MADQVVRALACNGQIRAFAATTREMVEYARTVHNTSPVVTVALGRLLTAGAMMGAMLKGEDDLLTLEVEGNGPIHFMIVRADSRGNVKGYAENTDVNIPLNERGELDVAEAVGIGVLSVIRDLGLKEPYIGETILVTSEIAEDLTYYFAESEQTPSSVGLGVLMNKDNTVRQAGGFIIQLMPGATEEMAEKLEEKIKTIDSVTALLDAGTTPEALLEDILGDYDLEVLDIMPARFFCDCSKERYLDALSTLSDEDLDMLLSEDAPIEVRCQFCGNTYTYSADELREVKKMRKERADD